MPNRERNGQDELEEVTPRRGGATMQDKIAAFGMLDGMPEGTTQAAKCLRLALIGFTNQEIAALLQTTAATVSQNIYAERKKAKKPTVAPASAKAGALIRSESGR